MTLQALLITGDDSAAEVLGRVLPTAGLAVERLSDFATAIDRLQHQRFDALVIDFEDPEAGAKLHAEARELSAGIPLITIALVKDPSQTRKILGSGTHFVLYLPLSDDKTKACLRAVTALLNRERRRTHRVPVQAPVELSLPDTRTAEGILLDLSEAGMDVLTAEPQVPGALLNIRFQLPDGGIEVITCGQVAWANPNGQTGIRFLDLDESTKAQLHVWLQTAAGNHASPDEGASPCKLTDLSLGGCYVESDSPFPENALVDLCLRTEEVAVHTEGLVRVTHPGHGMGVEFPSRTAVQRAQVDNLINLLRSCPESTPQLTISPRALSADIEEFKPTGELKTAQELAGPTPEMQSAETQYSETKPAEDQSAAGLPAADLSGGDDSADALEDPLLELLHHGSTMQQEDFLAELRRQRTGEAETVAT
jgi:DNA-binding response OmpR family regulator